MIFYYIASWFLWFLNNSACFVTPPMNLRIFLADFLLAVIKYVIERTLGEKRLVFVIIWVGTVHQNAEGVVAEAQICLLIPEEIGKQRRLECGYSSGFALCLFPFKSEQSAHRLLLLTQRWVIPSQLIVSCNTLADMLTGVIHQCPRHFLI